MLTDLLELKLTEVKDRLTMLDKLMPTIYNSQASEFVKRVVRHKYVLILDKSKLIIW